MARTLPLDDRLHAAGQKAVRARIYFDLWWLCEGNETRPKFYKELDEYGEFFRFDGHVHFVAMITYLYALFEKRAARSSLPNLYHKILIKNHLRRNHKAECKINATKEILSKLAIVRGNAIAHYSESLTYDEAFRKAKLTPDELNSATNMALNISNMLLMERGLKPVAAWDLAPTDLMRILKALETVDATAP